MFERSEKTINTLSDLTYHLAPSYKLLHAQPRVIHVTVPQYFQFPWCQQRAVRIVMIEEKSFAVRTSHSDGIQPNISRNMGGVEVTNQFLSHIRWQLRFCQSGNILNPSRARFGESIHL